MGKGPVTITMADGEVLTGQYRVAFGGSVGTAFGSSARSGAWSGSALVISDGPVQFVARGSKTEMLCRGTSSTMGLWQRRVPNLQIFAEQTSSVAQRTVLRTCLDFMGVGGYVLMVTKPDRLARLTQELLTIEADLAKRAMSACIPSCPWAGRNSTRGTRPQS